MEPHRFPRVLSPSHACRALDDREPPAVSLRRGDAGEAGLAGEAGHASGRRPWRTKKASISGSRRFSSGLGGEAWFMSWFLTGQEFLGDLILMFIYRWYMYIVYVYIYTHCTVLESMVLTSTWCRKYLTWELDMNLMKLWRILSMLHIELYRTIYIYNLHQIPTQPFFFIEILLKRLCGNWWNPIEIHFFFDRSSLLIPIENLEITLQSPFSLHGPAHRSRTAAAAPAWRY